MVTLHLLFMLLAIIAFALAAVGIQTPRINLIAAGLCLMAIAMVVSA